MTVLLSGIVGSTAYGLAHEGSDIDRLGIFAYSTEELLGLSEPPDTIVARAPDITMHEARKAIKLIMGCNPTVTEILWLNEYEETTELGQQLINIRSRLLSRQRVLDAYMGYATQQFKRLIDRGKFNSDISDKRVPKHARHMYRLVHQGYELYTTGHVTIKLEQPELCRSFGEMVAADHTTAFPFMQIWKEKFNEDTPSVLPLEPDKQAAEVWLARVRKEMWHG